MISSTQPPPPTHRGDKVVYTAGCCSRQEDPATQSKRSGLLFTHVPKGVCCLHGSPWTCPKRSGLIDVWAILYTLRYRAILQTAIYIIYYIFSKAAIPCMYVWYRMHADIGGVCILYNCHCATHLIRGPIKVYSLYYISADLHILNLKHSMEWYVSVYLGYSSLVYSLL